MITVRLFAAAAAAAGTTELTADGATLSQVAQDLLAQRPALAQVLPRCSFLLDGVHTRPQADASLAGVATVDVLPPFAGG